MKSIRIRGATDYVELSLLGADGEFDPSPETFPSKFNHAALGIWLELMKSKTYARMKPLFSSRDENWTWCIRTYLRMCTAAGVFPFSSPTEQSRNDAVINYLTTARRRAILYGDSINLFERVRVLKSVRDYVLTPTDTAIVTHALLYPIQDPTFGAWLTTHAPGPMFRYGPKAQHYRRLIINNLDSRLYLDFNLVNMYRPVLSMTVTCGSPIAYEKNKQPPTPEDLRRFTEQTIWMPLVRSHRFKNIGNRLF